ncbi:MAG: DUF1993 domain-containing protein [Clostridia bacterium]
MPLSMYEASVPRFAAMLENLAAILDKAQAHCEARKIDPLALTGFRLYPDMFPFSRQVQIACDTAKGAAARLAGVEVPKHEDTEQTFAELKARIAKTLDFIRSVGRASVDGSEEREVVIRLRGQDTKFRGVQYLQNFAWPNFYFHVATAYVILRHNGVELGKRDFLGNPLA